MVVYSCKSASVQEGTSDGGHQEAYGTSARAPKTLHRLIVVATWSCGDASLQLDREGLRMWGLKWVQQNSETSFGRSQFLSRQKAQTVSQS